MQQAHISCIAATYSACVNKPRWKICMLRRISLAWRNVENDGRTIGLLSLDNWRGVNLWCNKNELSTLVNKLCCLLACLESLKYIQISSNFPILTPKQQTNDCCFECWTSGHNYFYFVCQSVRKYRQEAGPKRDGKLPL